jgi:hypothetical protein
MRRYFAVVVVAGLLVTVFVSGCGGGGPQPNATRNIEKAAPMKEVILREIPIGTPFANAQQFMETECFECAERKNGEFLDEKGEIHGGADFLYCQRKDDAFPPPKKRIWHIMIVKKDEKVAEVVVKPQDIAQDFNAK